MYIHVLLLMQEVCQEPNTEAFLDIYNLLVSIERSLRPRVELMKH